MTKKEALQIVFSCAASYKENLAGRSLLFVTTDKHKTVRCLEVSFDGSNFLHMTGFKLNKSGNSNKLNIGHFLVSHKIGKISGRFSMYALPKSLIASRRLVGFWGS